MTDERWDPDLAVTHGPVDAEPVGNVDVTGENDDWVLIDDGEARATYSDPTGHSPKELALHVESP